MDSLRDRLLAIDPRMDDRSGQGGASRPPSPEVVRFHWGADEVESVSRTSASQAVPAVPAGSGPASAGAAAAQGQPVGPATDPMRVRGLQRGLDDNRRNTSEDPFGWAGVPSDDDAFARELERWRLRASRGTGAGSSSSPLPPPAASPGDVVTVRIDPVRSQAVPAGQE